MTAPSPAAVERVADAIDAILNEGHQRHILIEAAEGAIAAHTAALAEEAWQPIESAPKDGTSVLVVVMRHGEDSEKQLVGEAYYRCEPDFDSDDGWWWANTDPGEYHSSKISALHSEPAHWQPLPAPPGRSEPT